MATLNKVRDIDIYRDETWYCGPGPSVVVYPDDEIVVAFRRSRTAGHGHPAVEACIVRSTGGGDTWSEPEVFDSGPIRNQNLTLLGDGTLVVAMPSSDIITREVYDAVHARARSEEDVEVREYPGRERSIAPDQDPYYLAERGPYVRRSTDRGRTWSQRYYVESVPGWSPVLPGFSAPFGLRARVIELSDGTLVFPIHSKGLARGADLDDPRNRIFSAVLVASEDGGMSWDFRGTIASPQLGTHFNETEVIETPSGDIVAFMRPTFFDDNDSMFIYTTTSEDGGRTWSPARKETVWGYPTSPLRMPSGRTLLTYGYRRPDWGIRAVLANEECTDIDVANELVVRGDGGMRDLGYPQAWLLNDGRAFVSYYFNHESDNGDTRYICATILEEA